MQHIEWCPIKNLPSPQTSPIPLVQKPYLVRLVLLGKHDDATAKADEVVSKIYGIDEDNIQY
jgi:hypothetical protein